MKDRQAVAFVEGAAGEVSLAYYLLVLWRFKIVIVVASLIGAGLAFGLSAFRSPVYEASARLLAARAIAGGPQEEPGGLGLGATDYAAILQNQSLVQQALKDVGLAGPPANLQAADFLAGNVTIGRSPEANILTIRVRLYDPQLAARVANRLSEGAVALARGIEENKSARLRERNRAQMEDAGDHLQDVERKLQSLRRTSRVDSLEADVDAMMQQRRDLVALSLEIEEERAKVAMAEQQLAREQPTRSFRRSLQSRNREPSTAVTAPPSGGETARPQAPAEQDLREEVRDPYANPVYELLAQQVAGGKARLAGLEARLRAVKKETANEGRVAEYHLRKSAVARLETEFDAAQQVYLDVSSRYQETRIKGAVSDPLQVIDQAVPSASPIPSRAFRNTVLGGAVGAILAMLVALAVGSVKAEVREVPSTTPV